MVVNINREIEEFHYEVDIKAAYNDSSAIEMSCGGKAFEFEPDFQGIKPYLIIGADLKYAWYYLGYTARDFSLTFSNVPGYAPISGCCSEWATRIKQPFFGSAKFYLYRVERANGKARIAGGHSYRDPLHCAVGYITVL